MQASVKRLRLTLAINDSDQVRDLLEGRVEVQGITLTCLRLPVEEIFYRVAKFREWEVSEMSMAKFTTLQGRGENPLVAIPVFTSRVFRHSAIFVRSDGSITDPAQLRGRRIGIPEWTQTATVYARGILEHEYGVGLRDVDWVQAGTNEPGRIEGITFVPPEGVRLTAIPGRTLNAMLCDGEIDALIAAHPPRDFKLSTGRLTYLFADPQAVEEQHFRRTGIFPIMHTVVIRRDVYERHPWVAMELTKAFDEAKRRSVERMVDPNAPFTPVPWAYLHARRAQEVVGDDLWPYGIETNRATLSAFLDFAQEQGLTERLLEPDELFVDEVKSSFRI